jgi:predicted nucleic acid-binding protein
MTRRGIVDSGPLVAIFSERDQYHAWAVAALAEIPVPYITCEAVLSEASFLLRAHGGPAALIEFVRRGLIEIPFRLQAEIVRVQELMKQYSDVPMSLAEACLVRLSEQHRDTVIVTADRDFRIYRKQGRQAIPVLTP